MAHAGPSITITSFTNALAFYFGSTTKLPALSDFCIFACLCVICLYLSVLTIFVSIMAFDTKRINNRKSECCGLCCCSEDSRICCKGYFLSDKQKEHSGLEEISKKEAAANLEDAKKPGDLTSPDVSPVLSSVSSPSPSPLKGRQGRLGNQYEDSSLSSEFISSLRNP